MKHLSFRVAWPLITFVVPSIVIGYGFVLPGTGHGGVNELSIGFAATLLGACVTYVLGMRAAKEGRCLTMTTSNVDIPSDVATLTRIGQGRAAEVFALDGDRVIKVAREGAGDSLEREAAAMRVARAAGMPVPAAHALVEIGGRRALVMGRARGIDMLSQLARRPWTILRAGAKLGRLHARLHETTATADLPPVKAVLERRIATSDRVPPVLRDRVLRILRNLPDGDRLCHLDYHPANVMTDGAEMTVIDWSNACRGDPLADVAATMMALQGGKTAPGTPLVTRLRLLAPIGRKLLLGGYLRGYRKQRPFDRDRLARWCVIAAAQRLTYGIAGEQVTLLRVIEKGT